MKKYLITVITAMTVLVVLTGCGQSNSAGSSNTASSSKKDAAATSYSKEVKKQEASYSASESRKKENEAKSNMSAFGTKYVTYVRQWNANQEFWGLDLKNGENYDASGRSEYEAYEFLPNNEFYWVDVVAQKSDHSKGYISRRGTYKVNGNTIEYNFIPKTWYRWTVQDDQFKILSTDPGSDFTETEVFSLTKSAELTAEYNLASGPKSKYSQKAQEPVTPEIVGDSTAASINVLALYTAAQTKYAEVGKIEDTSFQ